MARHARVWNLDFVLLWQGQLVSALGDAVYRIALGFWILAVTGSTALMGTLLASSVLPRIVLSPLAGTIADRFGRKWLLVLSDLMAGVAVVLVGVAALAQIIEIWMVFAAGIIIGIASAFFDPAVLSSVPDLVPKTKLTKANSALSLTLTGSAIVGNALGGFLFQALGAPLLFLTNGVSYLLSALSEVFIRIPKLDRAAIQERFWAEMRAGFAFVWHDRGLRTLYAVTSLHNFFTSMAFVLLLPLFQRTAELGAGSYGLLLSALSVGAFAGFVVSSVVNIPPERRFFLFILFGLVESACMATLPWMPHLGAMLILMGLVGLLLSAGSTVVTTALQLAVPEQMRGKAFGLRSTLMMGLVPLAMAAGGLLAEVMSIALLISAAAAAMFAAVAALLVAPSVRQVLETPADG